MKIVNNSEDYPNYTKEQLEEEPVKHQRSRELAEKLGTSPEGVDQLIALAKAELEKR